LRCAWLNRSDSTWAQQFCADAPPQPPDLQLAHLGELVDWFARQPRQNTG
jgi:hypothetical protein